MGVRQRYALSDAVGTTLQGSDLAYGVIMLLRHGLALRFLRLYTLPTRMSRAALIAGILIGCHELRVATAHLESLDKGFTMPVDDGLGRQTRIDRVLLGRPPPCDTGWRLVPRSMRRLGMEPMATVDAGTQEFAPACDDCEATPPRRGNDLAGREPGAEETRPLGGLSELETEETDPEMPELVPFRAALGGLDLFRNGNLPSDHFGLLCEFEVVGP